MILLLRIVTLFLLASLLPSCEAPKVPPVLAFYHWQTQLDLDKTDKAWLTQTGTKRLYVKFFDLTRQGQQLVPVAKLQAKVDLADSLNIVPTIFLTNASMHLLQEQQATNPLAIAALVDRCDRLLAELWPKLSYPEIQFDCDWTARTRETFFAFLREWRQRLPAQVTLSATLRLHQYRYPQQTGIPPVDRLMLMYYNVDKLEEWETENSILNLATTRAYLAAEPYPLPIDLALPLFRWGVLFRNGQVLKLITNLSPARLADTTYFQAIDRQLRPRAEDSAKQASPATPVSQSPRFLVKKSTYLDGYYLYAGDLLRLETVDSTLLVSAARQWRQSAKAPPRYLAFYHLDEAVLAGFTYKNLQDCAQVWLSN